MGGLRVAVMGGSLGGLNAALWLRDLAGCEVDVYERSNVPLAGQGAGIVLNPATVRYFTEYNVLDPAEISVPSKWVRYIDQNGGIADETPANHLFSSYNALYRSFMDCFGEDRYHLGEAVDGFEQGADGVDVYLASGQTRRCDMLVCADGIRSLAQRILFPKASLEYAGYVAWRGTAGEADLSPKLYDVLRQAITYYVMPNSHMLTYPIPMVDGSQGPQRTSINWLWYQNVPGGPEFDELMTDREGTAREVSIPPGLVGERQLGELQRAAASALPPPLIELMRNTGTPYIQAIFDSEVPRMASGRVCLIGDGAFAVRPHAAVGTAKATEDGYGLAKALKEAGGDVSAALEWWEPGQLELGKKVLARAREAGNRSQFDGTWRVGQQLPFGLYEVGDSEMSVASSQFSAE